VLGLTEVVGEGEKGEARASLLVDPPTTLGPRIFHFDYRYRLVSETL
jgi:hypothetical protein